MKVINTRLDQCFVIEPTIYEDHRGYFVETFNHKQFLAQTGMDINFVQDNESYSTYGVLRGIHFQHGAYAQAKLVRVTEGEVLDVAVDLRKNTSTFGQYFTIKLSDKNKKQLFIPRGFGHGFVVLSKYARFLYKCDNYYNKTAECGILYNDRDLGIDWNIPDQDLKISEKDLQWPNLKTTLRL